MSVNPPVPPAPDPCTSYETNGVLDLGLMIDDATTLVGCAYIEAQKLTGLFGHMVLSHVGQALVMLERAKTSHAAAKNEVPPTK
jgi:hypothetical protein